MLVDIFMSCLVARISQKLYLKMGTVKGAEFSYMR